MSARFITSAAAVEGLPSHDQVEVAFIGRSNVGKSSLLGAFMRKPGLVRTSRTPGRTQLLNLFSFEDLMLVDLPGYGYAKVSKVQRTKLERLIFSYIERRVELSGVVLLLDARRTEVQDLDREMTAQVLRCERPLLLAINKIDLIPKNQRLAYTLRIEKDLGVPRGSAVAVSAKTGEGRHELLQRLKELRAP